MDVEKLIEKLKLIEALHAGATTQGERVAAEFARERIQERIRQTAVEHPPIEFTFTMNNRWSRKLFVALLRRYDIRPYRYRRQRHTTVMARVSEDFVNKTLWPEFVELDKELTAHLDATAEQIIRESFASDSSEAEEVGMIGHAGNGMRDHDGASVER